MSPAVRLSTQLPLLLVVMCAAGVTTYAQPTDPAAPQRPAYQTLRFDEDWSALAGGPLADDDVFDPIKYMPLTDDGLVWASFGGQARLRFENWNDFGFGGGGGDDAAYLLTRLRLHGDLHVADTLRVFVEGISALSTDDSGAGPGLRTLDVDEIDLLNGFVDLNLPLDVVSEGARFTFRGGRQELLLGRQRLISPLDWANTRRTFDGLSVIAAVNDWTITGFWVRPAPVRKYDFNDALGNSDLFGLYAAGLCPTTGVGLDAYYIGLDRVAGQIPGGGFNGSVGHETRHTLGTRVHGKCVDDAIDYDLEGAYQFGQIGSADISAYMLAAETGYTFADVRMAPRLSIGVDYASGDHAAGGDVETFNQLFPLGHAYLGWIDAVGRQNIIDLSPALTLKPLDKMTVQCVGHLFWLADDSDALYNAGGAARAVGTGSNEVGAEIDLLVKYAFDRHTTAILGYSHFFAGDYVAQSGSSGDVDFFYAILEYTF